MKNIFRKLLNIGHHSKEYCYFIHIDNIGEKNTNKSLENNKNIKKIYFNPKINDKLYGTKASIGQILTEYQGRRLFYRFLKENNFFSQYCYYLNNYHVSMQKQIIQAFETPFNAIMSEMTLSIFIAQYDKHSKIANDLRIMSSLAKKWIELLKSIRYI